jgi:predicted Zn-dependent peptidase
MKKILLSFLILVFLCPMLVLGQELKSFTLKNGLTVYVWEDTSLTDVFGMVSVKAGSVDDPEGFTGLAHYLEHLMFKGTNRIGALDWEKERPIYETIKRSTMNAPKQTIPSS